MGVGFTALSYRIYSFILIHQNNDLKNYFQKSNQILFVSSWWTPLLHSIKLFSLSFGLLNDTVPKPNLVIWYKRVKITYCLTAFYKITNYRFGTFKKNIMTIS